MTTVLEVVHGPVQRAFDLKRILAGFDAEKIRTTINQNVIIRWIQEERLSAFHEELVAHSLGDPGAELVEDIIACPGTDTCGLGITSSKGMARALASALVMGE